MTTPELSQSGIGDLFAMWRRELAAFAGESFAGSQSDGAEHIAVVPADDAVDVFLVRGKEAVAIGSVSRQQAQPARALSTLLSTSDIVPRGTTDVAVVLPASQVLRPHLQLPSASHSTLRKAAFYELERLSPVDPNQVYFDIAVRNAPGAKKAANVDLRIVKKATVDSAIALCREAGLAVGAIGFVDDPREADRRYFPVETAAFLRMRWRRFSVWLLAGLAVVLFLLLLAAAYWRGSEEADLLSDQADAAAARAAVVHHLKRDIRDVRAQIEFPLAQKQAPGLIQVLSEVTQILPTGTWLTELAFNDGKVHVQGFSNAPSDLIGLIDKSPYFANAQFEASLQSAQDHAEHFDLSFDLKAPGSIKHAEPR